MSFTGLIAALLLAGLPVSVKTKDGKEVEGTLELSRLEMQTSFGSSKIDVKKVVSIEFGDPDVVVLEGDQELRGKIALDELVVKTKSGERKLKRGEVRSLTVRGKGRRKGEPTFAGTWLTNFGPMKLTQHGLTVKGTYGWGDVFSLEGKLKERTLHCSLHEGAGSAQGDFELWKDGRGFHGTCTWPNGKKVEWAGFHVEPHHAAEKPGETTTGVAECLMRYHLHLPPDYAKKKSWPAIVMLHGSNMNSAAYLQGITETWPDLAKDFVLIGIDGEHPSTGSSPEFPRFNYTYVNFSGPGVGPVWMRNQSPALVADTLKELKGFLHLDKIFVGGHSQGGFLTYAVFLYYPELVDGAFPMSCSLLVQCEPDVFKDRKVRAAQRKIPVAVVHGRSDRVVDFSSGQYCYNRMIDGGFPMVHFFAPKNRGHAFIGLPVGDAIRWLQKMSSGDPKTLVDFAEKNLQKKEYRDAAAALDEAAALSPPTGVKRRIDALQKQIDAKAEPEAKTLLHEMARPRNGKWADKFLSFREEFAPADAARKVLDVYARLRARQEKKADEVFYAARSERNAAKRRAKWKEIVDKYYASKWYQCCKNWLAQK